MGSDYFVKGDIVIDIVDHVTGKRIKRIKISENKFKENEELQVKKMNIEIKGAEKR